MTKKTILPLQLLVAPDKNDPAPLILYHGRNCPDGFGASLAAWLYYGDASQFGRIIQANPALDITTHLQAGDLVLIPVLPLTEAQQQVAQDNLPPWKRST